MADKSSGLRSPLARARGLGSAKEGVHHWWAQRVSALALIPLVIWFVISLYGVLGEDHATVTEWVGQPLTSVLLVTLIIATFYHGAQGLQVVYEDYIAGHWARVACDLVTKGLAFLLAAAGVFAVLKIAFTA